MPRRTIPWTFSAGALLIVALLLTSTVSASKPAIKVPNVRGHWDGFFLLPGGTDGPGFVRADFTQQANRRIVGAARLFNSNGSRFSALNFNGTIGIDDVITATGRTSTGRVVLQSEAQFFTGRKGDAGVMDAQINLLPKRGQPIQVGAILLHPFPDNNSPDVSGEGIGVFHSSLDSTFSGDLSLEIGPRERNTFPGQVSFTPQSPLHAPFSWQSRATVNSQGRLIVISQGKTGRMVVDGAVLPRRRGASSVAVDGFYTLHLNDGLTDFGTYNFSLTTRNR